jgi:hypothetical protein
MEANDGYLVMPEELYSGHIGTRTRYIRPGCNDGQLARKRCFLACFTHPKGTQIAASRVERPNVRGIVRFTDVSFKQSVC